MVVSVMCALALVAPYRFRGSVVLLASVWASGVCAATVAASWHRPSDAVGSDLLVVVVACVAVAVLAARGDMRAAAPATAAGRRARGVTVGLLGLAAVATAAYASVVGAGVVDDLGAGSAAGTGDRALSAGLAVALFGSTGVALAMLALLRHVDVGVPRTAPHERDG
jgi:hypothetical protein